MKTTKLIAFTYRRLKYYLKIWLMMSKNAFIVVLTDKKILLIFLFGKILRFSFFITFLFFIVKDAKGLAGYSVNEAILFFLTFMLIDTIAQFFFREVYRFRPLVISGDFDLILLKPMSPLVRVLTGGADVIDLITIPPLLVATYFVGSLLSPNFTQVVHYLLLILNGLVIATAFHVAVISLGIITLEIDNTVMIYRDITSMGRFPIDIYKQPIRDVLTFIIPVGIMITLPTKAMLGKAGDIAIVFSLVIGVLLFYLSLRFWSYALKRYTSASS